MKKSLKKNQQISEKPKKLPKVKQISEKQK